VDPYRSDRLSEAIRKALSDLVARELKDPRVAFVSLGAVALNRDHSVARVFVSCLGDTEESASALSGLRRASGFLQRRLGRTLRLRQVPELRFVPDESAERGVGVEQALRELEARGEFASENERRRALDLSDFQPPADLLDALVRSERTWILPHWNPDPDAVGAALALAEALRGFAQDVTVFSYPDPPLTLGDLPGSETLTAATEAPRLLAERPPDLVVLVDAHRRERCGMLEETLDRIDNVWCIDHHLVRGRRVPLPGWVEPRACSACTLVYCVIAQLAERSGEDSEFLTESIATNIYAGLLNDTGGFRFSNTLPLSFELARRLAQRGVDTAAVARRTLHRFRPEGIALLQRVLAGFTYHAGGRVLTARVSREMLAETGATLADTETFVNLATGVEGVRYVAFFKELDAGVWRVSLRVRGEGDIASVAARHGGGGHRQAAGCTLEGNIDDLTALLVAELSALDES
jgi:phosphoesterase RecJ-like protein